jgi:hypothetical protein
MFAVSGGVNRSMLPNFFFFFFFISLVAPLVEPKKWLIPKSLYVVSSSSIDESF